jgi:hypothetical protein
MSEREFARLMKMASRPVGDDSPAASMRSAAKRPRTEDHDSDEDCGITRTADSTPKEAAPAGLSTPAGAPPTGAVFPALSMGSAVKRPRTEDHDSDEDRGIIPTFDSTTMESAPAGLSTPAGSPPTGAVAAVSLAGASSSFRYQRYPFFYPCCFYPC